MPCKNAKDSTQTFSLCVLGLYGGRPSHGTCVNCDKCTDVEWHKQKVKEMLARQPVTPVSRVVVAQPVLPVLSDIGDKLAEILDSYGFKKGGCNCRFIQNLLNSKTRDQVLQNIQQLAAILMANLKANPAVLADARWWIKLGVKISSDAALLASAEKLLRQACE